MKTTLDLPEELVREVKIRAAIQRRTVKDLVAEFIREGLGMVSRGRADQLPVSEMVQIEPDGLPVIRCRPSSPASRLSLEELLKLESDSLTEEDMQRAGLSV